MGLKFFENNGGKKMYYCAVCHTYLADKAAVMSTSFTGVTGQAYLFNRVSNVRFGELAQRQMMTGYHYVRDVFCNCCNEHLGWMYELAPIEREKYKEGSIILERLHIIETEGITKIADLEPRVRVRPLVRREAMMAQMARMGNAIPLAERERHHRELLEMFREEARQFLLERPFFQLGHENRAPVIRIHNEAAMLERLGIVGMDLFRQTLRQFNAAIVRSAEGMDNHDLMEMGFRTVHGRAVREIRECMDGDIYRPSDHADRGLIELFDRMLEERGRAQDIQERPQGLLPPVHAGGGIHEHLRQVRENMLAFRQEQAEVPDFLRMGPGGMLVDDDDEVMAQEVAPDAQPPLDPDHEPPRGPMAAMMADQDMQAMIRQRMEDFRENVVDNPAPAAVLEEQDRRIQEWEELVRQQEEEDPLLLLH